MKRGKFGTLVVAASLIAMLGPSVASAEPGDLDPAFGAQGQVQLSSVSGYADVVTSQSGDVYVAKVGSTGISNSISVVRLSAGGQVDASFGDSGSVDLSHIPVPGGVADYFFAGIQEAPGGGVIVGVSVGAGPTPIAPHTLYLVRVKSDGSIDQAFGDGGLAHVDQPDATGSGLEVFDVDSSGRILAAGDGAVYRLGSDGQPDPGFAGDGAGNLPFTPGLVSVAADDSVYATGSGSVAHLLADGTPDPAFNAGVPVAPAADGSTAIALVAAPAGQVYVSLRRSVYDGAVSRYVYRLLRLDPDGSVDASFGLVDDLGDRTYGMAADDQGRLLLPGNGSLGVNHPSGMKVTRLRLDGRVDTGFGYDGSAFAIFPPGTPSGPTGAFAGSLSFQANGDIVAAGPLSYLTLGSAGLGVVRFSGGVGPADSDADGFLDDVDRCPFLGSTDHAGCASTTTDLAPYNHGHRLQGKLESPNFACIDLTKVRVVRLRNGKQTRVQTIEVRRKHGSISSKFRTKRLGRGRFFVRVKSRYAATRYGFGPLEGRTLGAGYCLGDRSYLAKVP